MTHIIRKQPVPLDKAINAVKMQATPAVADDGTLTPGMPVGFIGSPGIGKTAQFAALAEELGYSIVSLIGAQMTPEAIGGIPSVGSIDIEDLETGKVTQVPAAVYLNEAFQVKIRTHRKVVLLLDEFSNSTPDVQAAMLKLLNERLFPDNSEVPAETIIVLATNSTTESVNPSPIQLATQNRVFWLPVQQTVTAWAPGARTKWGKPTLKHELDVREAIVNYIVENPSVFYEPNNAMRISLIDKNLDKNAYDATVYAWRSPRSWDNYMEALARIPHDDKATFLEYAVMAGEGIIGVPGTQAVYETLVDYTETHIGNMVTRLTPEAIFADPHGALKSIPNDDANTAGSIATRFTAIITENGTNTNGQDENMHRIVQALNFIVLAGNPARPHKALRVAFKPTMTAASKLATGTGMFLSVPFSIMPKELKRLAKSATGNPENITLMNLVKVVEQAIYGA